MSRTIQLAKAGGQEGLQVELLAAQVLELIETHVPAPGPYLDQCNGYQACRIKMAK